MSKAEFDKLKVNLWVAGSVDKQKNGGWCANLHCNIGGTDYTKLVGGYAKETTATRMALHSLLAGLQTLKQDRSIFLDIYTSINQLSTGLNKNMYEWEKRGWLTTKGKPPEHLDLWQQIYAILKDKSRVMSYTVHLKNEDSVDQEHRMASIDASVQYLLQGKRDLYEVSAV